MYSILHSFRKLLSARKSIVYRRLIDIYKLSFALALTSRLAKGAWPPLSAAALRCDDKWLSALFAIRLFPSIAGLKPNLKARYIDPHHHHFVTRSSTDARLLYEEVRFCPFWPPPSFSDVTVHVIPVRRLFQGFDGNSRVSAGRAWREFHSPAKHELEKHHRENTNVGQQRQWIPLFMILQPSLICKLNIRNNGA